MILSSAWQYSSISSKLMKRDKLYEIFINRNGIDESLRLSTMS